MNESDISQLLMGMASQITEREDNIITPDLRGSVFGLLEFNRRDLMAINIQVKKSIIILYSLYNRKYYLLYNTIYDINTIRYCSDEAFLSNLFVFTDNYLFL